MNLLFYSGNNMILYIFLDFPTVLEINIILGVNLMHFKNFFLIFHNFLTFQNICLKIGRK